jgi:hypothetical protein
MSRGRGRQERTEEAAGEADQDADERAERGTRREHNAAGADGGDEQQGS